MKWLQEPYAETEFTSCILLLGNVAVVGAEAVAEKIAHSMHKCESKQKKMAYLFLNNDLNTFHPFIFVAKCILCCVLYQISVNKGKLAKLM